MPPILQGRGPRQPPLAQPEIVPAPRTPASPTSPRIQMGDRIEGADAVPEQGFFRRALVEMGRIAELPKCPASSSGWYQDRTERSE